MEFGKPASASTSNQQLLQTVFEKLELLGIPYIVGGDYNLEPQAVQQFLRAGGHSSMIVATNCPTCLGTTHHELD